MRMRLEDLPPALRARVGAALSGQPSTSLAPSAHITTPKSGAGGRKGGKRPYAPYRSKAEVVAANHLCRMIEAREIRTWQHEPFSLVLAPAGELKGCRYHPDFATVGTDGRITLIEVKGGYCWEDAMIKMKLAAGVICPLWGWSMELWTVKTGEVTRRKLTLSHN